MTFALMEFDHRLGKKAIKQLSGTKFGSSTIDWADVSHVRGVEIGWVRNDDGSITPYEPPLDKAQADQIEALRWDCMHSILAGFTSDALGSPHGYGANQTDQSNLHRKATAALAADENWTTPIWCKDDSGWAQIDHNVKQVQKLLSDFDRVQAAASTRLADLTASVLAGTSVADVIPIRWSLP